MQELPQISIQPLPEKGVTEVMLAAAAAYPLVTLLATFTLIGLFGFFAYRLWWRKMDVSLMKSQKTQDIFLKIKKLDHEIQRLTIGRPTKKPTKRK